MPFIVKGGITLYTAVKAALFVGSAVTVGVIIGNEIKSSEIYPDNSYNDLDIGSTAQPDASSVAITETVVEGTIANDLTTTDVPDNSIVGETTTMEQSSHNKTKIIDQAKEANRIRNRLNT